MMNRTKSSFSESFFPVFNGGYFLFHHSPLWASKYHVLNSTRTVLVKGFLSESYSSVRWIKGTQSSFSERLFSVFTLGYFLFHQSPPGASKYHFANSTRTVLVNGFLRGMLNSVRWINRTQSSFSESFFPVFNWRYFLFHQSPLWATKYHLANSTRTL